jgi:hypothetical protein
MSAVRIVAAFTASLMIIAGGCGGGGTSAEQSGRPVDVWARDFCAAATIWLDGQAREAEFVRDYSEASQGSNPDPSELRALVVDAASDGVALANKAVESLRAAGHPAVDNGAEFSSAAYDLFDQVRDIQVSFLDAARDLPVDDPDAFDQEFRELWSLAGDSGTALQAPSTLSEGHPEVRAALASEPTCERVRE